MYRVSFYRWQVKKPYGKQNRGKKGIFTKEFDTVLDPFMGSGTTLFAAEKMRRNSIGIDILEEYYQMVKNEITELELYLLEKEKEYALVNK